MESNESASFWDAVRSWADSAGLLLPTDADDPPRPKVPQAVCDSCPICQAAATLDQVNPQVVADMTDVARSLMTGLGSALASASEQRTPAPGFAEPVVDCGRRGGRGAAGRPGAARDPMRMVPTTTDRRSAHPGASQLQLGAVVPAVLA